MTPGAIFWRVFRVHIKLWCQRERASRANSTQQERAARPPAEAYGGAPLGSRAAPPRAPMVTGAMPAAWWARRMGFATAWPQRGRLPCAAPNGKQHGEGHL